VVILLEGEKPEKVEAVIIQHSYLSIFI